MSQFFPEAQPFYVSFGGNTGVGLGQGKAELVL